MGIFDRFRDQAKTKGREISDQAEQELNERTGGKHTEKIDKAQEQIHKKLGMDDEQQK